MTDRVPIQVASNGAIRYGIYDVSGTLVRYEYIKLEDAAVELGMIFNKANCLPDSLATSLGLAGDPSIADALTKLLTANLAISGYSKPGSTSALAATDTVNAALGKLEKGIDLVKTLLYGTSAPTTSTVGLIGQLYYDTTAKVFYKCTSGSSPYGWSRETVPTMVQGAYTGDGSFDRIITLGFTPKAVFIRKKSFTWPSSFNMQMFNYIAASFATDDIGGSYSSGYGQFTLYTNGFRVYGDSYNPGLIGVNVSGAEYLYAAFA